jgi:hypothetical protein
VIASLSSFFESVASRSRFLFLFLSSGKERSSCEYPYTVSAIAFDLAWPLRPSWKKAKRDINLKAGGEEQFTPVFLLRGEA